MISVTIAIVVARSVVLAFEIPPIISNPANSQLSHENHSNATKWSIGTRPIEDAYKRFEIGDVIVVLKKKATNNTFYIFNIPWGRNIIARLNTNAWATVVVQRPLGSGPWKVLMEPFTETARSYLVDADRYRIRADSPCWTMRYDMRHSSAKLWKKDDATNMAALTVGAEVSLRSEAGILRVTNATRNIHCVLADGGAALSATAERWEGFVYSAGFIYDRETRTVTLRFNNVDVAIVDIPSQTVRNLVTPAIFKKLHSHWVGGWQHLITIWPTLLSVKYHNLSLQLYHSSKESLHVDGIGSVWANTMGLVTKCRPVDGTAHANWRDGIFTDMVVYDALRHAQISRRFKTGHDLIHGYCNSVKNCNTEKIVQLKLFLSESDLYLNNSGTILHLKHIPPSS